MGSDGFLNVSICMTRGCLGPGEAASEPAASAARSVRLDFIVSWLERLRLKVESGESKNPGPDVAVEVQGMWRDAPVTTSK